MPPVQRIIAHQARGNWPADTAADSVALTFDDRHRRRCRLTTSAGTVVLLDLARAVAMADGDGLSCEDGSWIAVRAAEEPVVEITCSGSDQLAKVAWHLGNRHLPTEIHEDRIFIRPDHVIVAMVEGLGASTRSLDRSFDPEAGAYQAKVGQTQAGHVHR